MNSSSKKTHEILNQIALKSVLTVDKERNRKKIIAILILTSIGTIGILSSCSNSSGHRNQPWHPNSSPKHIESDRNS